MSDEDMNDISLFWVRSLEVICYIQTELFPLGNFFGETEVIVPSSKRCGLVD